MVRIHLEEQKIFVEQIKKQMKDAPEFHPDKHLGEPGYRDALSTCCGLSTYYGLGCPLGGPPY